MTTKNEGLDNSAMLYHIEQAQQSNFRTLSRLTEDVYRRVCDLELLLNDNPDAMQIIDKLNIALLHTLTQATYTGRALGGALNPNKSVPTDQRDAVRVLLEGMAAVLPPTDTKTAIDY